MIKERNRRRWNRILAAVVVSVLAVGTAFFLNGCAQDSGSSAEGEDARIEENAGLEGDVDLEEDVSLEKTALDAYEEFLEGSREVYLDKEDEHFFSTLESGKGYYLADLLKSAIADMRGTSGWEGWNDKIGKLQYAYLDGGKDGVEELAIRFYGMDIYSADDNSDQTHVIVYEDGTLFLRYSSESWARSMTMLYYYGYISSGGAYGGSHHGGEEAILDSRGKLHTLYTWDSIFGYDIRGAVTGKAREYYCTVYGDSETGSGGIAELTRFRIGEEEYFIFYSEGKIKEWEEPFLELCKQEGMRFVTAEEMEQYTDRRLADLGFDQVCLEERELTWHEVDNPAYAEYLR